MTREVEFDQAYRRTVTIAEDDFGRLHIIVPYALYNAGTPTPLQNRSLAFSSQAGDGVVVLSPEAQVELDELFAKVDAAILEVENEGQSPPNRIEMFDTQDRIDARAARVAALPPAP